MTSRFIPQSEMQVRLSKITLRHTFMIRRLDTAPGYLRLNTPRRQNHILFAYGTSSELRRMKQRPAESDA